jgi:hypothetical protein
MSAVAPVPGTVAAGTRAGRVAFRPASRPVASGGRARPPPTVRPRATDDDDAVELVFVRPSDADPEDVVEVRCAARVGENLLAAAMRCGAVDAADHFCLEGRCDACVFENCETDEPVRGCQTAVETPMRLWQRREEAFFGNDGEDDEW